MCCSRLKTYTAPKSITSEIPLEEGSEVRLQLVSLKSHTREVCVVCSGLIVLQHLGSLCICLIEGLVPTIVHVESLSATSRLICNSAHRTPLSSAQVIGSQIGKMTTGTCLSSTSISCEQDSYHTFVQAGPSCLTEHEVLTDLCHSNRPS